KITDLSGRVFNKDGTTGFPTGASQPVTVALVTDVALNNANLVDADGDGVGDSRWERAPIPLMTGVEYFMAVRIIDASSLLNVASASAITSDGTNVPTSPSEVTGYYPTSLDFTRLLAKRGIDPSGDIPGYFTNVRNGLLGATPPTPFGLSNLVSYTTDPDNGYVNGQIRGWREGVGEAGNLTPYAEATLKLAFRNAASPNPNGTTSEYEDELAGALDAIGNNNDDDAPETEAYWSPDLADTTWDSIRHMVTTITGENVYSKNHDGDTSSTARTRVDLNHGSANDIKNRLEAIYGLGGGYGLSGPDVSGTAAEAAAAFALNIAEYGDANGTPDATINAGGKDWYGMEALPFIREAYMQVGYEDQDTNAEPSNWFLKDNSHGLIVEVANPFDRPIVLDQPESPEIQMVVIERDSDGIVIGSAYQLPAALGQIEPFDTSGAQPGRHIVALYSNGGTAFNENGAGQNLETSVIDISSAPAGYRTQNAGNNRLANVPTDTELGVALQVRIGGTWVTYDRLFAHGADSLSFPPGVPFAAADGTGTQGEEPAPGKEEAYMQRSIRRDDRGINFLSNAGKKVFDRVREGSDLDPPIIGTTGWPTTPFDPDIAALHKATNLASVGEDLSNFQIPMANRHIFSVAELGWIMTFGFNDSDTGDFPQLFSGADGNGGIDVRDRFLRFDGATDTTNTTAVNIDGDNLTYAQLVIDEFTTLHPRFDGLDNDGDGTTDNAEEQFVFGTMNLNTAPRHIAALAASYPGPISASGNTGSDELIGLIQNDTVRSMGQVVSRIVGGTSPPGPAVAEFDLYPMVEAETEFSAERYPLTHDAEDAMKRAQFFLQGFSNRSDIYIAHIFVAGYQDGNDDGDYTDPGDGGLIESGRMIVVFSRAKLRSDA
ncbi:MAG: hypothetical protein GVY24_04320, partial [Planctomycetes bacterium]|nr:hypothetical protein [Planctomycetota bacterium]